MNAAARGPGFRATVAALALGQILNWAALYYAFSSFVLPMMRAMAWDKTTVMGAYTLGLACWGASTYAVGAAIDRGHGRWVLSLGALLSGLGFIAWSQVQSPWALYGVWMLLGACMAMSLYDPAFNVLAQRYPERYRESVATLTLVGGFASTLSFPACEALIQALDWRQALIVIGLVQALFVAPLHAWALPGPGLAPRAAATTRQADMSLHEATRQRSFWLLTACFTCYAFANAAVWAHLLPAFEAKGWSTAQALAVIVWIGPAQVLGRLVYVGAAGRLPLRLAGLFVTLAMPLSLALFAVGEGAPALLGFALLFGAASGLFTIVRGGVVPEYYGRSHLGRISGAMGAVALFARAAAPLATAALLALVAGYGEVLWWLAGVGLLAAITFALAKPPR
jgi:MFS family permease